MTKLPLKKVIISGGGTGGHIFPAIAIADALKEKYPSIDILFVGANGKMEMQKVPAAGYQIIGLNIEGFQRSLSLKNVIHNLTLPLKLFSSINKAKKIIHDFSPQVVIGVGGYASASIVYAAGKKKIPVLIQEQNSYPGKTNQQLSKYAQKICVAYPDMSKFFEMKKVVETGNPIRANIEFNKISREEANLFFKTAESKKTLLVVGGSLGALAINEGVEKHIKEFHDSGIQVIWQTGKGYYEKALKSVEGLKETKIIVTEFIEKMDYAYSAADLVISRAGAMAISELSVLGKPSIFVPLPTAAEDHQTKNAMSLVNRNAAYLIKNSETKEKLKDLVFEIIHDNNKLLELRTNILGLSKKESAKKIVTEIENIAL